jgi:hypothetical protein
MWVHRKEKIGEKPLEAPFTGSCYFWRSFFLFSRKSPSKNLSFGRFFQLDVGGALPKDLNLHSFFYLERQWGLGFRAQKEHPV